MLALRQLTQSVLPQELLSAVGAYRLSWPIVGGAVGIMALLAPSWFARGIRRWPECADGHFKNA
jgi:hypothetical protein